MCVVCVCAWRLLLFGGPENECGGCAVLWSGDVASERDMLRNAEKKRTERDMTEATRPEIQMSYILYGFSYTFSNEIWHMCIWRGTFSRGFLSKKKKKKTEENIRRKRQPQARHMNIWHVLCSTFVCWAVPCAVCLENVVVKIENGGGPIARTWNSKIAEMIHTQMLTDKVWLKYIVRLVAAVRAFYTLSFGVLCIFCGAVAMCECLNKAVSPEWIHLGMALTDG